MSEKGRFTKKVYSIVAVTAILVAGNVFADDSSKGVSVTTLTVTSDNTVTGDVTAENGGAVSVGDTNISNATAEEINTSTKNKAKSIKAFNGGKVSVGKVSLSNIKGGKYNIHTGSNVGNLEARDKGEIDIGKVDVMDTDATVTVNKAKKGEYNNNLQDVKAVGDGSKVRVGNVAVSGVTGNLGVETGNLAKGLLHAENAGEIHMGNVTVGNSDNVDMQITSINRANKGITAQNKGKVNMGTVYMSDSDNISGSIRTDNTANDTITADGDGSVVHLGAVSAVGVKNTDLTVNVTNSVNKVDAKGGTVQVGSASLNNVEGGTVGITSENHVGGTIKSTGKGSSVSIGNTRMQ